MRWKPYCGWRCVIPGHRVSVAIPPYGRGDRRYGYVWPVADGFAASVEDHNPGEIIDRDLGTFATQREARHAVEAALSL